MRLDLRCAATADLGDHAAIVPGKPDDSELLKRVTSRDADEMMPPPKSKKSRLSDDEIAILRQWIDEGAAYEDHWAFLPLSAEPPPAPRSADWVRNPIDAFVLAKLEENGLTPSPEADRPTLIRRLYLDLLGLLPTPDEVGQFLGDRDPHAFEMLVERVLASPHYGERWGRHWLDQARYADSNGYALDAERVMWPYRDWVIRALNDDLPFDRFTVEQLAGDLLAEPKKEQLVATAFHRNTLINLEGGSDPEQFRVEAVMDRVNTTGAVWLGLTVGCAQCHSHKFDPITQREYYQLFAFFNSTDDVNNRGPTVEFTRGELIGPPPSAQPDPPPDNPDALAERRANWERGELARLESSAAAATQAGSAPVGAEPAVAWLPVHYEEYGTESGAGFQLLEDNSLLSDGRGSFNDTYRIDFTTSLPQIAAIRLRTLTHDSLPKTGPGLAANGNFVLTDFELILEGKKQIFVSTGADHEQPGFSVAATIDVDPKSGWAINVGPGEMNVRMNADHEAWYVLAVPLPTAGKLLRVRMLHDLNKNYLIGRFALEVAATPPGPSSESLKTAAKEQALLVALRLPAAGRSADEAQRVQEAFDRAEAQSHAAERKSNPDFAEQMIMRRAQDAARDLCADPRRFHSARHGRRPGRPGLPLGGFAETACHGTAAHAARSRPLACQPRQSVDASGHDESPLDALFWPWPGRNGRRFWCAGGRADASRIARLAGYRADPRVVEHEAHAPADRHQRHLSASFDQPIGTRGARSAQSAARPPAARAAGC